MRILNLVFAILLIFAGIAPGFAQGWGSYANKRYGASADIPPGFEPMGPEAANSDGLIFRSRQGGALVTIFGTQISGGFEKAVADMIAYEHSYHGWNVTGQTVTPDWAEYAGNVGGRQLRVRVVAACNGKHAIAAKLEFNGNMNSTVNRVFRSLKAGPAKAC